MATPFNIPSVAELLLLCKGELKSSSKSLGISTLSPENAFIVSGAGPKVTIATLRLKGKNDNRKICRHVAIALTSDLRGMPAWSEQDVLADYTRSLRESWRDCHLAWM